MQFEVRMRRHQPSLKLLGPGIQEPFPFHLHGLVHAKPQEFHHKTGSLFNQGF